MEVFAWTRVDSSTHEAGTMDLPSQMPRLSHSRPSFARSRGCMRRSPHPWLMPCGSEGQSTSVMPSGLNKVWRANSSSFCPVVWEMIAESRCVPPLQDRKSTPLNSSHRTISYAVFCLKKKNRWVISTTIVIGEAVPTGHDVYSGHDTAADCDLLVRFHLVVIPR